MSDKSKIEWCETTVNSIVGCSHCSPGCDHCYAERMARRLAAMGQVKYRRVTAEDGKWSGKTFFDEKPLTEMVKQKKPRLIFHNSMGDTFHANVADCYIDSLLDAIFNSPQHKHMILTKRIKSGLEYSQQYKSDWACIKDQIWLGVTICNQQEADEKIPILLQIPAAVRFVSVEPMLGPVDLSKWIIHGACGCTEFGNDPIGNDKYKCVHCKDTTAVTGIDWVICGGESGPGARPMHPDWARSLRDQCQAAGVPFLFKQWGEWVPDEGSAKECFVYPDGEVRYVVEFGKKKHTPSRSGYTRMYRLGKKKAGRSLDGKIWNEYPNRQEKV